MLNEGMSEPRAGNKASTASAAEKMIMYRGLGNITQHYDSLLAALRTPLALLRSPPPSTDALVVVFRD